MKKKVAVFLVVMLFIGCCTGCGGGAKQDIRRLNRQFCHAYNHLDMDEMFECLEPKTARMLSALEGLAGGMISDMVGIDLDGKLLADLALGCYDFLPEEYKQGSEMPEMEIETKEIELNDDENEATAVVDITIYAGSESETESVLLYYTMVDDVWYLSDSNFQGMF